MKLTGLEPDIEHVGGTIKTRLRAEEAPLHEYLFSRSVAGTTADDLIEGLKKVAGDKVYARFFHLHPKRNIRILDWLSGWMKMGVVPLLTLNLQRGVAAGEEIPDAWHHQMVYGVDSEHIHVCNLVTVTTSDVIEQQLCSESVLKVRREDVLSRLDARCDLEAIESHQDVRWSERKVKDQVLKILQEEVSVSLPDTIYFQLLKRWLYTSHIDIPAAYKSGVTLCVNVDNRDAYEKLNNAEELPIL
ncbi:hypothetical protein BSL78_18594 [Apostichopus japonicus]|uniref:Uncharacterized protein n=1 Tax=Stichopus japonicus TaxID=307972 RepID=A0A2G8K9B0_STIJA|nr:hypothetical protein BSL78_18594 [Apostichopus japonicus]